MGKFEATSRRRNDRRSSLLRFVLSVGLLFGQIGPANASDDLLDPGKIGAGHWWDQPSRTGASDDLLVPTRSGARAVQSTSASHEPSYAQGMAGSVVSSLDSLTRAAANLMDEILKLEKLERDLSSRLLTLQFEMNAKLEEYRQGLFCSGACGLTKSEILAKRETFPHEGQTIIRATPEQIAAKERQLQAPIDQTGRELRDTNAKRLKATNEREEALLQIGYGLNFWRTCISFEDSLIWLGENESAAVYKAARAKTEDQIAKLRVEMLLVKDEAKLAVLSRENEMWITTQDKLDRQRASDRRDSQNALQRAATTVSNQLTLLHGYLTRGKLGLVLNTVPVSSFASSWFGVDDLGGKYRMGSYTLAGHDERLPNVSSFIIDFRNSPRDARPSATGGTGSELAPNEEIIPKLKGILRDLLKCDPTAGEKCPPPPQNPGTGVRG
jgi:hypothetical protein